MAHHIDVFVSSTSEDLRDHRAAVRDAILDLGLHPIMMENFAAEGIIAVDRCKRSIDEAELYVGIYAHRYGWVPTEKQGGDGVRSITALEYDWAGARGIPRLCFVIAPKHPWPPGPPHFDKEPEKTVLLNRFKGRVSEETMRKEFTDPADLAQKVTAALHHAVLELTGEAPTPGGWRRLTAPPLLYPFVGRAVDRERIGGWLREPDSAVIVRGPGGIGKTYLAQHLARELENDFPGGVLWASFGPEARDADSVLPRVLAAWAGASPHGRSVDETRLTPDLVRALLRDAPGRLLVVLDDVWQVAPARALLAAVPDGAARLVTTRDRRVSTLGRDCPLDRLDPADAFTLLADRVRAAGADPDPYADGLRAFVRLLDGHALALDLAARQVIERGADFAPRFADRLARHLGGATPFRLLAFGPGETREDSLETALFLSYDALGDGQPARRDDLQAKFRALGVLAPDTSFSARTAYAAWDADMDDPGALEDAEDALVALVRAGLVAQVPGSGRYEQHLLLHHYARTLANDAGDHDAALGRYTRHVIDALAMQFPALPPEEWDRAILPDRDQIHHVGNMLAQYLQAIVFGETPLEALAGPEPPASLPDADPADPMTRALVTRGLNFGNAVYGYVFRRRVGEEGRRWLMAGLACARLAGQRGHEGLFAGELGQWSQQRGQYHTALAYFHSSLAIGRQLGYTAHVVAALNNIASAYHELGQAGRALDYFEQALAIVREAGNQTWEATMHNNIGEVHRSLGQLDTALDHFERALPVMRETGNRAEEATTLSNMGLIYAALHQPERALAFYEEALPLRRLVGDRAGEATTLHNMGDAHRAQGEPERALDYHTQALLIEREIGDRAGEALSYNNMGTVYSDLGQPDRALELYRQALTILRETEKRDGEAGALHNMAAAYRALGQPDEALALYQQALSLRQAIGDRAGEALTCSGIGMVLHEGFGNTAEAIPYLERCVAIMEDTQHPSLETARNYLETLRAALADE